MFMGLFDNKSIDSKNRMFVPAKHRALLGEGCVITIGMEGCLCIYSLDEWQLQSQKMEAIPQADLTARKFIRLVFSHAAKCEFDSQGRITIPENLKTFAHIDKDIVIMGVNTKIEVWAKERWEAPDNDSKYDPEEAAEALLKYNF